MNSPDPSTHGVFFTRAKLMLVFQERNEYRRVYGKNGRWSRPFESTAEARAYGEANGWIVSGTFMEKRKVLTWREV